MTNPSINFKVGGDENVSSFMDKLKQKSDSLTAQFIKDAQIQTSTAKEQVKLLEEKIKSMQRLATLQKQIAEASVREGTAQRIGGIESRGRTIDYLYEQTKADAKAAKERFQSGSIGREEYNLELAGISARKKRIEGLAGQNVESVIIKQGEKALKDTREAERSNQILAAYMRENINTIRQTSQQQVNAVKQGDEKLIDAVDDTKTPQEKLVTQLTQQQISEERFKDREGKLPGLKTNFANLANAFAIERVGGMVAGMPSANNELDYIKPMLSSMGLLLGGLPGMMADMATGTSIFGFSLGQSTFGQLGMQLGSKMGEFAGDAVSRTYRSRDELQTANFRLKAMGLVGDMDVFGGSYKSEGDNSSYQLGGTGMFKGMNQDFHEFAMDMKTVSKLQSEIAIRQGSVKNLTSATESILAGKGVGVNESTSLALIELLRSNRDTDKDLSNIIGGALGKGSSGIFKDGDRAYLNEFLTKNYMQLQRTLLQTQTRVGSGTAMDILSKFDAIGGQFAAKDFRSTGLISGIQSSLANPQSESMKALMFTLMRQSHPEMELGDIQIEMQKGLGSPKQLQSLMKYIVSQGGSRSYQLNQVAGAFGLEGNLSAASELLSGYEKFGESFDVGMLKGTGVYSKGSMLGMARDQTSPFAVSSAEIENEFIKSSVLGIEMVGNKMKGLMGDMLDGLKLYIETRIKEMFTGETKENSSMPPSKKGKWDGGAKF